MSAVTMDLGAADVHTTGGGAPAKKAPRKRRKFGKVAPPEGETVTPPPRRRQLHIRADISPGGSLHVRHMNETFSPAELVLLSDAGEGPKWIQLAKPGRFLGHPSGPFEMTGDTFQEIVRNFKASPEQLPIDFEHASEADATDGTIPQAGAPAQGWITDMKIEGGNLFGLVEWGTLARDYIRDGKYKYFSPAIRFGAKDRVTGKPIGARMTSGALTNSPFLAGLQRLAAKDVQMAAGKRPKEGPVERGNELVHKPHEYMPQIRMCLGLHQLASAKDCADHLDKLRDHVESCGDASGTHEGVDLSSFTKPMRELVDAAPGDTWDSVFDTVEDLIHAAIGEHVVEDHGGQAEMADPAAPYTLEDDASNGADMSDEKLALALKDTKTKNDELGVKLKDAETKLGETTVKLTAAEAELVTLREERAKRIQADIEKDVDDAIDTYPSKLKLSDRDNVIAMATAAPDAFRKLYPFVVPSKRHLMREVTPPERRPSAGDLDANGNPLSINGQIKKLMSDKKISWADAANEVAKLRTGR